MHLHLSPPCEVTTFEFRNDLWRLGYVWHYLRHPMFSRFHTIPECDRQTHTLTYDDGIYHASRGKNLDNCSCFMLPLVCNGVVVVSQSFFEVCWLPFSSRPN